jgi:hypothetical protein
LLSGKRGCQASSRAQIRWSVDHLFLDQDGIPTLVEVKRSSDTRIRREVVGQMLDYAANAVVHWPVETIKAKLAARHPAPEELVASLLAEGDTSEAFWDRVQTNLDAGKVRLLFVADKVPAELLRIVEFLNSQMKSADVLAVEVKQYVGGGGLQTLVPRVLGRTAESEITKGRSERRLWDEPTLLREIEASGGAGARIVAEQLLRWTAAHGDVSWGTGPKQGSFALNLSHKGVYYRPFGVSTNGKFWIAFDTLSTRPLFADTTALVELRDELLAIPGVQFTEDYLQRWPSFSLTLLSDKEQFDHFTGAMKRLIDRIKHS